MPTPDKPSFDNHSREQISDLGAVILCGGKSSRLGLDKSQLIFNGQTFLNCIIKQVSEVTEQIVVVGNEASGPIPQLPDHAVWERDQRTEHGPLEGIRVGFRRLSDSVKFAFVTSCDVPLLNPALIRFLYDKIGERKAIVPVDGPRVFGMTAIYRTNLHGPIEQRIKAGQLRVSDLADAFEALKIPLESLTAVDPQLDSLTNINSADDYLKLLKRFAQECPPQFREQLLKSRQDS
jgi:molybdopterin-guanine dinucleotide biosynthesis protein A